MNKKPTTKIPTNTQITITPTIIKKPIPNLSQKSQILLASGLLPKDDDNTNKTSTKSISSSRSSNPEPEVAKYGSASINPSAIRIKKIQNENPPEKLNKYLSFYQSSKIILSIKLEKHLKDKIKECTMCKKAIDLESYNVHVDNHASKVLDWLYIGSYNNATNINEIELHDIKYILNCAGECRNLFPDKLKYCHLKLSVNILLI